MKNVNMKLVEEMAKRPTRGSWEYLDKIGWKKVESYWSSSIHAEGIYDCLVTYHFKNDEGEISDEQIYEGKFVDSISFEHGDEYCFDFKHETLYSRRFLHDWTVLKQEMQFGGKSYQENEFVKIEVYNSETNSSELVDIQLDNFIRDFLEVQKKGGKK